MNIPIDDDSLGFEDLPDDVIRRIIRISPRWNLLVLEYFNQLRKCARLRSVKIETPKNKENTFSVKAVFDDSLKYYYGGFFGDWTKPAPNQAKTREVVSAPVQLISNELWGAMIAFVLFITCTTIPVCMELERKWRLFPEAMVVCVLFLVCTVLYHWCSKQKAVKDLLISVFSSGTRIDTLLLTRLTEEMEAFVMSTLGGVKIETLEISGNHSCEKRRDLILHFARKCNLRRVIIKNCDDCRKNGFSTELARLRVNAIYE